MAGLRQKAGEASLRENCKWIFGNTFYYAWGLIFLLLVLQFWVFIYLSCDRYHIFETIRPKGVFLNGGYIY